MLTRAFGGLVAAMTLCALAYCQDISVDEATSLKWERKSIIDLERVLPDSKAVQVFIGEVLASDHHGGKNDPVGSPPVVSGYKFVDLKGDGEMELVSLLDYTGRMRPTELMVIENRDGHLHTAHLYAGEGGLGIGEIQRVVRDIKHDGRSELLIPYALEPFISPVIPTPHLVHVYVYQNGELVQSDGAFLNYYKGEVLPKLEAELEALVERKPASDASSFDREVYQKSIDAKRKEIDALVRTLPKD
jgi:hypothetical protein